MVPHTTWGDSPSWTRAKEILSSEYKLQRSRFIIEHYSKLVSMQPAQRPAMYARLRDSGCYVLGWLPPDCGCYACEWDAMYARLPDCGLCMRGYHRTGERTRYPRCAKQRRAQHRIGKAAAETPQVNRITKILEPCNNPKNRRVRQMRQYIGTRARWNDGMHAFRLAKLNYEMMTCWCKFYVHAVSSFSHISLRVRITPNILSPNMKRINKNASNSWAQ